MQHSRRVCCPEDVLVDVTTAREFAWVGFGKTPLLSSESGVKKRILGMCCCSNCSNSPTAVPQSRGLFHAPFACARRPLKGHPFGRGETVVADPTSPVKHAPTPPPTSSPYQFSASVLSPRSPCEKTKPVATNTSSHWACWPPRLESDGPRKNPVAHTFVSQFQIQADVKGAWFHAGCFAAELVQIVTMNKLNRNQEAILCFMTCEDCIRQAP